MRTQAGHAGSVKEPEVPEMRGERGARGAVVQGGRSHAVLALPEHYIISIIKKIRFHFI